MAALATCESPIGWLSSQLRKESVGVPSSSRKADHYISAGTAACILKRFVPAALLGRCTWRLGSGLRFFDSFPPKLCLRNHEGKEKRHTRLRIEESKA